MRSLRNILLSLVVVGCGGATAEAVPSRLSLENSLTLVPTKAALSAEDAEGEETLTVLPAQPPEADVPEVEVPKPVNSVTHIRGVQYADLKNDVMTLAYRNHRGLGLGAASVGGLALTAGYATEGGMRVNLYYVHAFPDLAEGAARVAGFEVTDLPERSVGFTIGWKF